MNEMKPCAIPECKNEILDRENMLLCGECIERVLGEVDARAEELGLPVTWREPKYETSVNWRIEWQQ